MTAAAVPTGMWAGFKGVGICSGGRTSTAHHDGTCRRLCHDVGDGFRKHLNIGFAQHVLTCACSSNEAERKCLCCSLQVRCAVCVLCDSTKYFCSLCQHQGSSCEQICRAGSTSGQEAVRVTGTQISGGQRLHLHERRDVGLCGKADASVARCIAECRRARNHVCNRRSERLHKLTTD